MQIFDAQGRLVATPLGRRLEAGEHSVTWDGRDARGDWVGAGVYFYRAVAGGQVASGRLVRAEGS